MCNRRLLSLIIRSVLHCGFFIRPCLVYTLICARALGKGVGQQQHFSFIIFILPCYLDPSYPSDSSCSTLYIQYVSQGIIKFRVPVEEPVGCTSMYAYQFDEGLVMSKNTLYNTL